MSIPMNWTQDTVFYRNPDLMGLSVDDEWVMLDEQQGRYFALNAVGRAIWMCLAAPLTYEALVAELLERYAVEKQNCVDGVVPFLQQMLQEKLIFLKKP